MSNRPDATKTTTAQKPKTLDKRTSVKITALRNANYHEDRERFFEKIHTAIMLVVVVGGVLTLTSLFQDWPQLTYVLSVVVVLAGLVDVTWGTYKKATCHASLREASLELYRRAFNQDADKVLDDLNSLLSRETPTMGAVNALAYNNAMRTLGRPEAYLIDLTCCQTFWRNWFSFSSVDWVRKEGKEK